MDDSNNPNLMEARAIGLALRLEKGDHFEAVFPAPGVVAFVSDEFGSIMLASLVRAFRDADLPFTPVPEFIAVVNTATKGLLAALTALIQATITSVEEMPACLIAFRPQMEHMLVGAIGVMLANNVEAITAEVMRAPDAVEIDEEMRLRRESYERTMGRAFRAAGEHFVRATHHAASPKDAAKAAFGSLNELRAEDSSPGKRWPTVDEVDLGRVLSLTPSSRRGKA